MNAEITHLKNILLAEDDPEDAKMTLAALQESHLADAIVVVRDGAEALDYLYYRGKFQTRPAGNPILVLLDNKMPKVSGLEVLKAIKTDEHLKSIPVVAFSSSGLKPDLIEFYKHGVNAYVVKPMEVSEFTKVIKQLSVFWLASNEPPPSASRKRNGIHDGNLTVPGKEDGANETDAGPG